MTITRKEIATLHPVTPRGATMTWFLQEKIVRGDRGDHPAWRAIRHDVAPGIAPVVIVRLTGWVTNPAKARIAIFQNFHLCRSLSGGTDNLDVNRLLGLRVNDDPPNHITQPMVGGV